MTLSISLLLVAGDRAQALLDGQHLSDFDPRALLAEHPLHLDASRYVAPDEYGRRLLAALGGPALLERLAALPRAPHPQGALVLRVADPQLAAIPWEYLHTGAAFVAFEHFLLREVAVEPALLPPTPDPARPWRLVVMASDPLLQELRDDKGLLKGHARLPRLRVANELDALRDGLRAQQPPAPLRWQRIAPARAALIDLASPEPILFHYTGHGSVQGGKPVLCFDDGAGTMRPQPVGDLATDLRGRTYFAFLNACRTADSAEPGANLALTLVRNGVPAVLGMQTRIADEGAALLAETFYGQLAAGIPLEEALYRARLRLADRFGADPAGWGIPALYRAAGYRLPSQTYAGPPPTPIEPPAPRTQSLQAPARLLGREVELTELMRLFVLDRKRVITVRGPGGMGKTALVHELAARLRFHFRDGIFAVTLALAGEQAALNAAALRAELARRLELRHPAFDDPGAAEEQEQAIVGAAHGRRVLLIFDNYETVLWRLGKDAGPLDAAPADRAAQADLYARYEVGLALLIGRLGRDHADHAEALVYQHRMAENIAETRRYGDTDTLKHERNRVVDQLNRLALDALNQSFEDLCGPATADLQSPISNPSAPRPTPSSGWSGGWRATAHACSSPPASRRSAWPRRCATRRPHRASNLAAWTRPARSHCFASGPAAAPILRGCPARSPRPLTTARWPSNWPPRAGP